MTVRGQGYTFTRDASGPGGTAVLGVWANAWSSSDQCVTVVGPGGVGKTALASEAVKRAAGRFALGSRSEAARHDVSQLLTPTCEAPYERRPARWENDDGQGTHQRPARGERGHDTPAVPVLGSQTGAEERAGQPAMGGSPANPRPCPHRTPPPRRRGFWERHIHPWILDLTMDTAETRRIRQRVCAPLSGAVLEIGFGTGHNLPFLPSAVARLLAVEPLERGAHLAADRITEAHVEVEFIGSDAQQLPLPDRSVDAVLCTWSLCSMDDPQVAVREVARVLRPGGGLHFVEHGLAPEPGVRSWQHRCNPLYRRLACGCHLDRDIPALITGGGMQIDALDSYYMESERKTLGWTFEGRATTEPPR